MILFGLFIYSFNLSHRRKQALVALSLFTIVASGPLFAQTSPASQQQEVVEAPKLPPVEVGEAKTSTESTNSDFSYPQKPEQKDETQSKITDQCHSLLVSQDIEKRYKKVQSALEADYAEGMPKQLRTDLVRVRKDIDSLSVKLFEVNSSNSQEVNHIVQLTIDYLDKMISLLPKANKVAPKVRDQYVVPFTNISSIKAEHQDCMMQAAIEGVKNDEPVKSNGASINIYKKLTSELERLNENLYVLQTTDVQRFVSYRAKLLKKLERYNQDKEQAVALTSEIPSILNNVHREIETLLPGLELSTEYLTVAH